MSLEKDGVWKGGLWAATVWASGVWREGVFSYERIRFTLAIKRDHKIDLAISRNIAHTLPIAREIKP